jgi:hypothetical protein
MLVASPRFELAGRQAPTIVPARAGRCDTQLTTVRPGDTLSESRSPSPPTPPLNDGRTWWAHLAFTRINTKLTILKKEIEDFLNVVVFSMSIVEFARSCRWSLSQHRSRTR